LTVVVDLIHDWVGRSYAQRCRRVENRFELHNWDGFVKLERNDVRRWFKPERNTSSMGNLGHFKIWRNLLSTAVRKT
jgi:hypothetical protein